MSDVTQKTLDPYLTSIQLGIQQLVPSGQDVIELVKHVQYAQADFVTTSGPNIHPTQAAIERESFTIPSAAKGSFVELFITAVGDPRTSTYRNTNSALNMVWIDLDPSAQVVAGTNDNDFGFVTKPTLMSAHTVNNGFGIINSEWIGLGAAGNNMAKMWVGDPQPVYVLQGSLFDPLSSLLGRKRFAVPTSFWTGDSTNEKDNYFARLVDDQRVVTATQICAPRGHLSGLGFSWSSSNNLAAHPTFVLHARVFAVY